MEFTSTIFTYEEPIAASVPLGMLVKGSWRSPLMLMPARIPVTVEKNRPNIVKKFWFSR